MPTLDTFTTKYLEQAALITQSCHAEAQEVLSSIPAYAGIPSLTEAAKENRGVVLHSGGELLGFLSWNRPWEQQQGYYGTWSQLHASGACGASRSHSYNLLYQGACEVLVTQKVLRHIITTFTYDRDTLYALYLHGFGCTCIDAILDLRGFQLVSQPREVVLRQATAADAPTLAQLDTELATYLRSPPILLSYHRPKSSQFIANSIQTEECLYYVAEHQGGIIAFLQAEEEGEDYISDYPGVININRAYTQELYRQSGVGGALLAYAAQSFIPRGYTHCRVDYESSNSGAVRFWQRHFTPYSHTLERRI
ncbi:MAG: GNAT family N-acetyltransferase [Symbiobacteriaceae bacterium]|nr:GNAT family N-acetyltransferase [Symbiobacteriaceae bacterium]